MNNPFIFEAEPFLGFSGKPNNVEDSQREIDELWSEVRIGEEDRKRLAQLGIRGGGRKRLLRQAIVSIVEPDNVRDSLCSNRISNVILWLNAFIPRDIQGRTKPVPAFIARADPSMAGKTMFETKFGCGLTDQRSFSSDITASSRMHSEVKIDLDKHGILYQKHRIDPSIQINCGYGVVTCKATSPTNSMNFKFLGVIDKEILVRVVGSQGPACPASMALKKIGHFLLDTKIDYNGTFFIKRIAKNYVDIGFLGKVDQFPAYEFVVKIDDSNPVHLGGILPKAGTSPVTHLGARQKIHFVRRLWLKCKAGKQVAGVSKDYPLKLWLPKFANRNCGLIVR